ncbi:glutaredoxin-like protein NrdH [Leuconostoc fallax]|nr:glutaredoxin-like protein NrdH [Leuconostoc fallax]MBU7454983.1 glutaredoxin-like protein NrdH [Leuconostoc fallax]MCO6183259.1 glutaredoxin-like protein NrdH [Leuconostoc fallax]
MENITVYTKYNCVQCKMTKKFLSSKGVSFKEINIDEEVQYVDELKANGHRQTPVVAVKGVTTFTGFRPDMLAKITA